MQPPSGKGGFMLRGLTTISYRAEDIEAAKRWYAKMLGIEPYFLNSNEW